MGERLLYEDQLLRGRSLGCRCITPRVRFCGDMEYDEHSTGSSLSGPTAHSITREPLINADSFDRSLWWLRFSGFIVNRSRGRHSTGNHALIQPLGLL